MKLNKAEVKKYVVKNLVFDFSRIETRILFCTAFFILLTYTFLAIARPDLDVTSDNYLYDSVLFVGAMLIYMIVSGFLLRLTSPRNQKSLD